MRSQSRISCYCLHSGSDFLGIVGVDQEGGFPCDFGQRGKVGGDDGGAAGHCFQDGEAKAFPEAGEDKGKSLVDHSGQLAFRNIVEEFNLISYTQSVSVSFESGGVAWITWPC